MFLLVVLHPIVVIGPTALWCLGRQEVVDVDDREIDDGHDQKRRVTEPFQHVRMFQHSAVNGETRNSDHSRADHYHQAKELGDVADGNGGARLIGTNES